MTNKHHEDMRDMAEEIISVLLNRIQYTAEGGPSVCHVHVHFGNAKQALQSYLLDAYNKGYDDAILSK